MTSLFILTIVHVAISLIGIVAGLIAMLGFASGRKLGFWNMLFLVTTILTSVTGFFYPFKGITPGIVIGIVSLIILAVSAATIRKPWSKLYIVTAAIAEFLNVLVLVVQSFQKIPPLHQLAPKGNEPVVAIVQLLSLVFFTILAIIALRRRPVPA